MRLFTGFLIFDVDYFYQFDSGQSSTKVLVGALRHLVDDLVGVGTYPLTALARVSLVSKKVLTARGTSPAIIRIDSSLITLGPLGIRPTRPRASAPIWIASRASTRLWIQQIFTRVRKSVIDQECRKGRHFRKNKKVLCVLGCGFLPSLGCDAKSEASFCQAFALPLGSLAGTHFGWLNLGKTSVRCTYWKVFAGKLFVGVIGIIQVKNKKALRNR